jgi:hypothetical protein
MSERNEERVLIHDPLRLQKNHDAGPSQNISPSGFPAIFFETDTWLVIFKDGYDICLGLKFFGILVSHT